MKEFVKKKGVIVKDELGIPNHMTIFYMEPGTYKKEDVPEMFIIREKIVPAILISKYHNTMIETVNGGAPASLPCKQSKHTITIDEAAEACTRKGKGWHLMTNTEFVYLLHEAEKLGHEIGRDGNDNHAVITWSHDGTAGGVFWFCDDFREWVTGLRLHKGVIEYMKNNDAAVQGYITQQDWTVAEVNGKPLKLYGSSDSGVVMSVAERIEKDWDRCKIEDLRLEELKEVPEIAYKLGIVPHKWENETARIWVDSRLEEAVSIRGSCFFEIHHGGANTLLLNHNRSQASDLISFRSALFLENWELVKDLLKTNAEAQI